MLFDFSQCAYGAFLGGEGWWSGALAGATIQGAMPQGAYAGYGRRGLIKAGKFKRIKRGFFILGAIESKVVHIGI
jgi:hypothetical protein